MSPARSWAQALELSARFPIARDLRHLQAEWDRAAASDPAPMPIARPSLARFVLQAGLLLLGVVLGAFITALLP